MGGGGGWTGLKLLLLGEAFKGVKVLCLRLGWVRLSPP
jgi:hypothetical protein